MIQIGKYIKLKAVLVFALLLISAGCLKDNVNPASNFETSDAINMLTYLEANGDIINSPATKNAFISAQDLYSNLSNYVILDIRDAQLFADGHISGAINIQSSDLLTKVKSLGLSDGILVSQNGQSASYYCGLLRLYGLSNVYVLKFGMAGWNNHFATQWSSINGFRPTTYQYFNAVLYNKGPYTNLPEVELGPVGDIKTKIENRIESLIKEKFEDGVIYFNSTTSSLAIYSRDAFSSNIYSLVDSTFDNEYIICYDTSTNYILPGNRSVYHPDHPPHSVSYNYYYDLKSIYYLQTIPTNRQIIVYSLDGHQSAFATAYLKLFGYNVKSVLFGATWLYPWLNPFPGSMDYPYVN